MELKPLERQGMELAPNAVRSAHHRLLFVRQRTELRQSMELPMNGITTVFSLCLRYCAILVQFALNRGVYYRK